MDDDIDPIGEPQPCPTCGIHAVEYARLKLKLEAAAPARLAVTREQPGLECEDCGEAFQKEAWSELTVCGHCYSLRRANARAEAADAERSRLLRLLQDINARLRLWCEQDTEEAESVVEMICEIREQLDAFESRSPDGEGLGRTGPHTASDSALSGELPMAQGAAKSSGATTAAKAERNSPKAGAGSEPADSHQSQSEVSRLLAGLQQLREDMQRCQRFPVQHGGVDHIFADRVDEWIDQLDTLIGEAVPPPPHEEAKD